MTALLHRLGYRHKKTKMPPSKALDTEEPEAFIETYNAI